MTGKSEKQKHQLVELITKDVVSVVNNSEDFVSVAIEEITPEDWTEKVYEPDILNHWDELYKKPGYSP